ARCPTRIQNQRDGRLRAFVWRAKPRLALKGILEAQRDHSIEAVDRAEDPGLARRVMKDDARGGILQAIANLTFCGAKWNRERAASKVGDGEEGGDEIRMVFTNQRDAISRACTQCDEMIHERKNAAFKLLSAQGLSLALASVDERDSSGIVDDRLAQELPDVLAHDQPMALSMRS